MLTWLKQLFAKPAFIESVPFADEVLGTFHFNRHIGWTKPVRLGDVDAHLVIGSDGEVPSDETIQQARLWVAEWDTQLPRIRSYIQSELDRWIVEPNRPSADMLQVNSINLLWSHKPRTSMIYFNGQSDDLRCWHVTFDGFEPKGLAYDD